MKTLVGAERAHQIMDFWTGDHYRKIYQLVLDNETTVSEVAKRHKLFPGL